MSEAYERALERIDHSVRMRLPKLYQKIVANPRAGKPLHGRWNAFRVRFLNFRIIYLLDEPSGRVILIGIGKRENIY